MSKYLADLKKALLWAAKNPATAIKSLVAFVSTLASVWGYILIALPGVSAAHAGIAGLVTGFITGTLTFLSRANAVVEKIDPAPSA